MTTDALAPKQEIEKLIDTYLILERIRGGAAGVDSRPDLELMIQTAASKHRFFPQTYKQSFIL